MAEELMALLYDNPLDDAHMNPFFFESPNDFLATTETNDCVVDCSFPCFSEFSNDFSFSSSSSSEEVFSNDAFDNFCLFSKRQKLESNYQSLCSDSLTLNCFNAYPPLLTAHYSPSIEYLPELLVYPPKTTNFQIPSIQVYESGNGDCGGVTESSKKTGLSPQSVAARLRRRKITEKTQELGKLIPGGNRMNTAEMFTAASKYIKFMQAQIGMLELLGSIQEISEFHNEQLHGLLTSPTMQEKLSSEEKCLVPNKVVEVLAKDEDKELSSFISKELSLLVSPNNQGSYCAMVQA